MEVELDVDAVVGVLVLTARGCMVGGALRQVRDCLEQAAGARRPVVLDLLGVEDLDDNALTMLRRAHERLATRLRLVVRRGSTVHAALKQAGLSATLALHASAATAIAAAAPTDTASRGACEPILAARVQP